MVITQPGNICSTKLLGQGTYPKLPQKETGSKIKSRRFLSGLANQQQGTSMPIPISQLHVASLDEGEALGNVVFYKLTLL